MKLTDSLLLKYVDGGLNADQVQQIEAMLLNDKTASEKVRHLQVSAEALTNIEPSPSELNSAEEMLEKVLKRASSRKQVPHKEQVKYVQMNKARDQIEKNLSEYWWGAGKIAAALVIMVGGIYAGYNAGLTSLPQEEIIMSKLPVWVARVVDYHTLYDRETVEKTMSSPDMIAQLESDFSEVLDHSLVVPALGQLNLEFKRGQVLKLEGKEIIQLVYLPNISGKPVALCSRVNPGVDSTPDYSVLRGLEVAQWRQDNIEYLLLGEQSHSQIVAIAKEAMAQIAAG